MYLCYIDESGTPQIPGNTSHFILAGLSIPIWHWKDRDKEIESIKNAYHLSGKEIHIAWLIHPNYEQKRINKFESLNYSERIHHVERIRKAEL